MLCPDNESSFEFKEESSIKKLKKETRATRTGRTPGKQAGFVNPPVYRGSTVLFPTAAKLMANDQEFVYGRRGSPTLKALETAICDLEGGAETVLTPSGLSAISLAFLAFVKQGDHILVTDSVYHPTRKFCDQVLKGLGVDVTYYDPLIGREISGLMKPETVLVFTESPGSLTFEMQDIPAIAAAAGKQDAVVVMDNTWATPIYFSPFEFGVDISIHSGTKYITGHADAMLGVISGNEKTAGRLREVHNLLGLAPGTEEAHLGQRGIRTLPVRLRHHWQSALEMANWLKHRPEVRQVIYPALKGSPGFELWKRDFSGASGLFSVLLHPCSRDALNNMLDHLELFGMGWSWGGFESLVIPCLPVRAATPLPYEGPALRFHIGLEDVDDLKADLAQGFERLSHDQ